jgi:hypothetical protein
MKKVFLLNVGDFRFEDVQSPKGLIGGKILATNLKTKEQFSKPYKRFHSGNTNKFDMLTELMYELVPPTEGENDESKE